MSQQYQSNEFKKLKKLWYQKLKEIGFEDVEQNPDSNKEPYLKEWHSHYFQGRHNPAGFLIQREYYYRASQFLNSYNFESELERNIWALHANGKSYRQITIELTPKVQHSKFCSKHQCDLFCPALANSEATILNKDKVNVIVRKLKEVMKNLYKVVEET